MGDDDRYPSKEITLGDAERLASGGFATVADGDSDTVEIVEDRLLKIRARRIKDHPEYYH